MRILVAYVAVTGGPITLDYISRFVASYQLFPPGVEHQTVVICNGGPLKNEEGLCFLPMNAVLYPRLNDGWDIGGFIDVAKQFACDMLVCLGESVYFHRAGWLARMVEAWNKFGPGMFGFWSSNLVRPHMNTTGFVCDPALIAAYPFIINTRQDRYDFEHGQQPFWKRVVAQGRPVRFVTWDGEWEPAKWRQPPNILWRGDQSNLLAWCIHSDRYNEAPANTRWKWEAGADRPFK